MTVRTLIAAATILLAAARPPRPRPRPAVPATKAKAMRCTTDTEIGTRLAKKRTCMTEAEWREMQQRPNLEVSQVRAASPAPTSLLIRTDF